MASWMEERDRLVAQTAAFVQQVAAAHPQVPIRPEIERLLGDKAQAIEPAASPPVPVAPVTPSAGDILKALPIAAAPLRRPPPISERSDIMERVATFRTRQARMNDEREAYYQTMREKIYSKLRNEPGSDQL
jgi:hypothetical protein